MGAKWLLVLLMGIGPLARWKAASPADLARVLKWPALASVVEALALPFAYMQARAGMVGLKVFLGIMLGIFFHMLNGLFAHIGLLQNWPPFAAAALPGAAFFLAAVLMMWWVERR